MFILTQDFAVDTYHPRWLRYSHMTRRSSFAVQFKTYLHTKEKPEMDIVWNIFRNELHSAYGGKRKTVVTCNGKDSKMYSLE